MKCPKCFSENQDTKAYCADCGNPLTSSGDVPPAFTKTIETPIEELTRGVLFADRYEIIEELGKGGMGKVYRVDDTQTKEEIALKLIKPEIAADKKSLERFRNELTTARKTRHKNVCGMFDLGEYKGTHYITMEYVSGEDLKRFIKRVGQLPSGKAIAIAKQICDGLEEAHSLGIIHRDLKANNIMIDDNGNARIMDFGIARTVKGNGITGSGIMIGTPEYMSPEQAEAKPVDQRSDIYSLGIILYEMTAGHLPFAGDTALAIAMKHKGETPKNPQELNPQIPDDLSNIILKCLEKDKENRYQNAGEIRAELDKIEQGLPTSERAKPKIKTLTSKEITLTFRMRKLFIPALIAVALIVIAIFIWRVLLHKPSVLPASGNPSVAIMYFKNNTGDAGLDHWRNALADLLITDLTQSKYVQVLSEDKLFNILGELDQQDAKNYSSEVLREVASRGQVNHVLVGSYTRAGDIFRMNITLQKAAEGEVVGSETVEGTGEQSFYAMVDELTRRIKIHFTLSQEQLSSDIDRRIEDITTNNPEALKFYIAGRHHHLNQDYQKSIQAMENAIAIDPDFAMAYRSLAMSYNNLRQYAERSQYIQKAMELSKRLPDRERYQIMGDYYRESETTDDKAIEAFTTLLELYPDTLNAINNLGLIYSGLGESEKAIAYFEEAIQRGDRSAVVYTNLASNYCAIRSYDKAKQLLEIYIETISDRPSIRDSLSMLYMQQGELDLALAESEKSFLLDPSAVVSILRKGLIYRFMGDFAKAEAEFQKAMQSNALMGKIAGGGYLSYLHSEYGRFSQANNRVNQYFEGLKKAGQHYWIARYHLAFSRSGLQTGQPQKALDEAVQAWVIADNIKDLGLMRDSLYQKGLAYLALDDVAKAEKSAVQLKEHIETGMNRRIIHLYYHFKAEIELFKGNFSQAVDLSQQAIGLLQYAPPTFDASYINTMALAYFRSGELSLALSEYKRITSLTMGRLERGDIYAKSFYMIGQIYEQQGDPNKAIENYEKFLDLWKDADPNIAEVEDTMQRLVGLQNN